MFIFGFTKVAAIKTLGDIQKVFQKSPALSSLHKGLVNQAHSYRSSIGRVERTSKNFYQHGRGSKEMVEGADHARRLAHNSFMSALTSVTRNAAKHGVNVEKLAPHVRDRHKATELAVKMTDAFPRAKKAT